MRILLIASIFPPQNAAGAVRTYGFARCWAEAGHDVTVLTTRKQADQNGFDVPMKGFRLVEVPYRVPAALSLLRSLSRPAASGSGNGNGNGARPPAESRLRRGVKSMHQRTGVFGASRMPDLTDFWIGPATEWAGAQQPWDVIVSCSGPYTTHIIARRLRRAGRARVWSADFRDLWTGSRVMCGLFPFTILERRLERAVLREADLVTSVSEPLAEHFAAQRGGTVHLVPNGSAHGLLEPLPREPFFDRSDGATRLVYTGTTYPRRQNIELPLRAVAALRSARPEAAARLRLVMAGNHEGMWRHRAAAHGVDDLLEHRGFVDRRTALHMQRDADGLLLLDWRERDARGHTSKVYEYLAAGPPILAAGGTPDSPLGDLLRATGRGEHAGSDERRITVALTRLLDRAHASAAAAPLEELQQYTIGHQAGRMLRLLDEAMHSAASR